MVTERKTKIIATLGPSTDKPYILKGLIESGLDVARLNLSHGDYAEHKRRIIAIRSLSQKYKKPVAIILDLQGPKIRVGKIRDGSVDLKRGSQVILTSRNIPVQSEPIHVNHDDLHKDLQVGNRVLLNDGRIALRVIKKKGKDVICKVTVGGTLHDHQGVNLPGITTSIPSVTLKDRKDIRWGIENKVDFIALSFVRSAQDVMRCKRIIAKMKARIPVIAKIEKPEALKNIEEIILASDGIMVARGDLGIEATLERVPIMQKRIIEACGVIGKPVITATQMLESMVEEPYPTRAEVSDVANAILDGTDAIMLSEETASGKYPLETFREMSHIAVETEKNQFIRKKNAEKIVRGKDLIQSAVGHAACHLAADVFARAIVTFTESGSSALLISKFRPRRQIYGITPREETLRRLSLYYGVKPFKIQRIKSTDDLILKSEKVLLQNKVAHKGDLLVFVAGVPTGIPGTTNLIKIHRLGEFKGLGS